MINLRFHVVSMIAVFLALAIGIAVGATVVDQGLVESTKRNLRTVENKSDARLARIAQLEVERDRWRTISEQQGDRLIGARLRNVPVVVLSMKGVDGDTIENVLRDLRTARANVVARLTFGSRVGLANDNDVAAARRALGAASLRPATVRYLLQQRVTASIVNPTPATSLEPLRAAGLLDSAGTVPVPQFPATTRVVVISGTGAAVPDDQFLLPILQSISDNGPARLVAVDATTDDPDTNVFVSALRKDADLEARVSTVDDVSQVAGRVATILAIEDLSGFATGHYGTARDAQRLMPGPGS